MLIGLVILAVLAILTFFGAAERFFRKIGIPDWLAFTLVLAFVAGAIVPEIPLGSRTTLNVGGFILPAVFVVVLFASASAKKDAFRAILATVAVAGVTVAVRMLVRPESNALFLVTSVVTGLLGGAVAYLAGGTRIATLSGAAAGIVVGDVVNNLLLRYLYGASVALGANGVFDAVILAAVTGIALLEIIEGIRRAMHRTRLSLTALNTEAAEDNRFPDPPKADSTEDELTDYFENND